jgi:hypothetical protein
MLFGLAAAAALADVARAAPSPGRPAVKILLSEPGVYRVSFEELVAAGWPAQELASARLRLRHRGSVVPILVEDRGDRRFGPGDAVIFAGERLAGEHGYFNEYSSLNVYWLMDEADEVRDAPGQGGPISDRLRPGALRQAGSGPAAGSRWQRRDRLEEDRILLRYPRAGVEDQELWYWRKLSYLDAEQFEVAVDLHDLDVMPPGGAVSEGGPQVTVAVEVRGWSRPRRKPSEELADHAVEVLWNGEVVGRREWSGTEKAERIELTLPVAALRADVHRLALRVPERQAFENEPLVDVSILNWVEIVAPRTAALLPPRTSGASGAPAAPASAATPESAAGQLRLEPRPGFAGSPAAITVPAGSRYELVTDAGERHLLEAPAGRALTAEVAQAGALWAVPERRYLSPRGLEIDRPSTWKSPQRQADYLLVAHPRLAAALAPLVALREAQGLTVAQVDVRDIYDEWSGGIVDPRAIRDFVDYAFHHWQSPAPRFLLLAGDASWDGKNSHPTNASPDWAFRLSDRAEFIQNGSTPYVSESIGATRNLIPTWGYGSEEGHAAGDNFFVAIDGDDELPDLAVGRFPVIDAGEVQAIVAKIVAYETAPPPGDWNSRVLWVTNEQKYTQDASDTLADELATRGYSARKIYPQSVVPPSADDQVALRGAFDEGALLVHFFGHGGRYIWRTGPPDLASQRDLFDLKDVEALEPSGMLPLVLSMTCYSAPFDHPTADSIGEKLLREPEKGAVAVFAASWRNGPRVTWSRSLVEQLLQPGTVGEALVRVKREASHPDLLRQYNLLGDPALRLALPPAATAPAAPAARSAADAPASPSSGQAEGDRPPSH